MSEERWDSHVEKWSKFKTLCDEYFSIIVKDHHKDKDRYFRISKNYDVLGDEDEKWVVSHDGYVNEFDCYGSTPDEALDQAIIKMKELIEKENVFQSR